MFRAVRLDGAVGRDDLRQGDAFGFEAAVFSGSSVDGLTQVPAHPSRQFTPVHAQAGRTYWIAVGSGEGGDSYEPFDLELTTTQPPLE